MLMGFKCYKDGQEFGSESALSMHLKDKHGINGAEISKAITKTNSTSYKLSSFIATRKKIVVSVLVIVVLALSISFLIPKSTSAQSVDGIQCNSLEGTVMHIHPHLSIIYNNFSLTAPAQIGIENTCLYGLHTHDTSGTIHVESPIVANYTLGEFFDIWNKTQPYDTLGILGSRSNSEETLFAALKNSTVSAYVDNATYSGNYRNITLKDREQIKLVIVNK